MMISSTGLRAAAVAFAFASSAVEAYDLKGFAPGMALKDLKAAVRGLECDPKAEMPGCFYFSSTKTKTPLLETLAGERARGWFFFTHGERVGGISVMLNTGSFDQVVGAMIEKYGQPTTRDVSTIETKMGVKHEQAVLQWYAGDQGLRVTRYAGDVNTMSVFLSDKASASADQERVDSKKKKGAKDL